jgi:hypothetical protein
VLLLHYGLNHPRTCNKVWQAGRPAMVSPVSPRHENEAKEHKETNKLQCPDPPRPTLVRISYEWMKFPIGMDETIIHMDEIDKMDRN